MISYGLPKGHRPVRLPKSYGPGPHVGITRCCGHMHTGVLWVICVSVVTGLQDTVRVPYVRPPRGPCGFHTGMGTSVRSVLPEPYGPVRICWLGNTRTISGVGPYGADEAHECTLGLYLPSQTHVIFDPLGSGRLLAFYGYEIAGSRCLKVVHAQPSIAGYTAQFKILRNILRTRYACRVISHVFTQLGPNGARRLSESLM